MTEADSVFAKALRMQAEVRRLEASNRDTEKTKGVVDRVNEIREVLGRVETHLRTAAELGKHTRIEVELAGFRAGLSDLKRRAADSIPSNQAFHNARAKAKKTAEELSVRNQETWREWTASQLDALPVARIPMLAPDRQSGAYRTLQDLRKTSLREASKSNILTFNTEHERLNEELSEASDAPEELSDLVQRIDSGGVTLRDLTNEDIALLREFSWDSHIVVNRKRA